MAYVAGILFTDMGNDMRSHIHSAYGSSNMLLHKEETLLAQLKSYDNTLHPGMPDLYGSLTDFT
jgi:hypothetical protein